MNIDVNTLKIIRRKKKGVTDPVRYPAVINKYEGYFKNDYIRMSEAMTKGIMVKMLEFIKR